MLSDLAKGTCVTKVLNTFYQGRCEFFCKTIGVDSERRENVFVDGRLLHRVSDSITETSLLPHQFFILLSFRHQSEYRYTHLCFDEFDEMIEKNFC